MNPLFLLQSVSEKGEREEESRRRVACSLCHRTVYRIDIHLRTTHRMDAKTIAYRETLAQSRILDLSQVKPVEGIDDLMQHYKMFLVSYGGGSKAEAVAHQEIIRIRRFIEDMLDGKPYKPALLRQFSSIGDVPGGILWRYENGYCRQGQPLKASTIGVYLTAAANFLKYLYLKPAGLRGIVRQEEIKEWQTSVDFCIKAFQGKRSEQDLVRQEEHIGTYCSPSVLGKFQNSKTVRGNWQLLDQCLAFPARRTDFNFASVRDALMTCVATMNGRRTGEIINMTLQNLKDARPSVSSKDDRIVIVRKNKVKTLLCKVNFGRELYEVALKYMAAFESNYLRKVDRVFPYVTQEHEVTPMSQTLYNQRLKRIWQKFVIEAKDPSVPPASVVCSSYFRHVRVTATLPTLETRHG